MKGTKVANDYVYYKLFIIILLEGGRRVGGVPPALKEKSALTISFFVIGPVWRYEYKVLC